MPHTKPFAVTLSYSESGSIVTDRRYRFATEREAAELFDKLDTIADPPAGSQPEPLRSPLMGVSLGIDHRLQMEGARRQPDGAAQLREHIERLKAEPVSAMRNRLIETAELALSEGITRDEAARRIARYPIHPAVESFSRKAIDAAASKLKPAAHLSNGYQHMYKDGACVVCGEPQSPKSEAEDRKISGFPAEPTFAYAAYAQLKPGELWRLVTVAATEQDAATIGGEYQDETFNPAEDAAPPSMLYVRSDDAMLHAARTDAETFPQFLPTNADEVTVPMKDNAAVQAAVRRHAADRSRDDAGAADPRNDRPSDTDDED